MNKLNDVQQAEMETEALKALARLGDPLIFDNILSDAAVAAINNFTRVKIRDQGFYRRIMPPLPINDVQLDQQVSAYPVKIGY